MTRRKFPRVRQLEQLSVRCFQVFLRKLKHNTYSTQRLYEQHLTYQICAKSLKDKICLYLCRVKQDDKEEVADTAATQLRGKRCVYCALSLIPCVLLR